MCTSRAPAFRTMRTSFRLVVPRTSESSTRITLFPCNKLSNRIELQLYAEIADCLGRFDEGSPDVVIADQARDEMECPISAGISKRGGDTGIGYGHNNFRIDGILTSQQTPHQLS